MSQRLALGLRIAVVAYFTFFLLRLMFALTRSPFNDLTWFPMAIVAEVGLILFMGLQHTPLGRRHPEILFLGASWSVTLVEQVWATMQGIAFPGLFAWTLVFLTQATLIPVQWPFHLIAQLGTFLYYYGVNAVLGLQPENQSLWDPQQLLYLFWFCVISNLSVYLAERLRWSEIQAQRSLEAEKARSERLLLNILPKVVASKLKEKQRAIADSFADVTVLFADIVGFTQISAGIPPHEVVELLNYIFSTFDSLADKHGLEKIKTIGDAYMVVGGLPVECEDHAEAIADMALDMMEAMEQISREKGQLFQIRIGINTGPVIAGVIGRRKFIYDLWGDAVNIASRMESQGVASCIQVTEEVVSHLGDRYIFEKRGIVHIKGKGNMTTYFLKGKR
ncbi:MAG: adenylate/guanylate cyclase domain-containing protein [Leptolyngbyaceae bacterium]|nr:adenylate/guanylate cyclase domain-containing protein [Leptolyngbyaceae bacterium]